MLKQEERAVFNHIVLYNAVSGDTIRVSLSLVYH